MIRRLLEAHYFEHQGKATPERIEFWLKELRTPGLLIELSNRNQKFCQKLTPIRPLLKFALNQDSSALEEGLKQEEALERQKDAEYWAPLENELEALRHQRLSQ